MKQTRFIFFGTPHIATLVLDQLEKHGFVPSVVVTAPDKKAGRKLELLPSPVKKWALERNIEILTPEKLSEQEFLDEIMNTDWDVFIVAMYAKIIPKKLLDLPLRGIVNVHPSLLPQFRGASPVLSAILADVRTTGVSIMQLNEKMDEGPILAQAKIELEVEGANIPGWPPKGSEFEILLAQEGGALLSEVLPLWLEGKLDAVSQDHTKATYTRKYDSSDALLHPTPDYTLSRSDYLKMRAFDKSPRAYFITGEGKRIIVVDADWSDATQTAKITRILPEGKKEMAADDFFRK